MNRPKWILFIDTNGEPEFRLGRVDFHIELLPKQFSSILGGGWFDFHKDDNVFYLFHWSADFGQVDLEDLDLLKQAISENPRPSINGAEFWFTLSSKEDYVDYIDWMMPEESKPSIEFHKVYSPS